MTIYFLGDAEWYPLRIPGKAHRFSCRLAASSIQLKCSRQNAWKERQKAKDQIWWRSGWKWWAGARFRGTPRWSPRFLPRSEIQNTKVDCWVNSLILTNHSLVFSNAAQFWNSWANQNKSNFQSCKFETWVQFKFKFDRKIRRKSLEIGLPGIGVWLDHLPDLLIEL